MLTPEREAGRRKADNYWDEKRYGSMQLKFLSERRASLEPNTIHRRRQPHRSPAWLPREARAPPAPPVREASLPTLLAEKPAREASVTVRTFTLSCDDEP